MKRKRTVLSSSDEDKIKKEKKKNKKMDKDTSKVTKSVISLSESDYGDHSDSGVSDVQTETHRKPSTTATESAKDTSSSSSEGKKMNWMKRKFQKERKRKVMLKHVRAIWYYYIVGKNMVVKDEINPVVEYQALLFPMLKYCILIGCSLPPKSDIIQDDVNCPISLS